MLAQAASVLGAKRSRLTSLRREHAFSIPSKGSLAKKDILDIVKKVDVQFVDMSFVDLFGVVKAVTIPISQLENALDHNVWFDGSSVEGFTRIFESDMYLKPDLDTFAIYPWSYCTDAVTARFICDVYRPDGAPFEGCPRYILKRQLEEAKKLGFTFNTGPELEFFLFKYDADGKLGPLPHDQAGYFDLTTDRALEIRQDMSWALDQMGVRVEALHHEVAVGQHEIDFEYGDALTTADRVTTFKTVLKAVAHMYGLHATFMPKPIAKINGSGMHVHQSFADAKTGKNRFFDKDDDYKLSEIARSFIAGQLNHIRALNALMNPTVNSYKRLVPGYEAPVYVSWATTNRSALVRIPRYTPGREAATRCELRCPDPSANPYIAFAGMLAAGLDGVNRKMKPPKPMEENLYEMSDDDRMKRGIGGVSENLGVALQELANDKVVRDAIGQHTFEKYYEAKMSEWQDYLLFVSKWELDRYLETY